MRRGLIGVVLVLLGACTPAPAPPGTGLQLLLGYTTPEALEAARARLGATLEAWEPRLRVAQLRLPPGQTLEGAREGLRGAGVRFLEEPGERTYRPWPEEGLGILEASWAWHLEAVRAPEVWPGGVGTGVKVAVGDTGLDETHPALRDRVAGVFLPGVGEVPPGEDRSQGDSHGTHVAGLVAAQGVGVAPGASLLSLVLFGPDYVGDFQAAQAILWAVDRGARVINLSFGGQAYSHTLHEAINYALDRRVVVMAAAGNLGSELRFYPAALPGVIAVGAVDGQGQVAWFSNRGSWVDLWAPGVRIYSTVPFGGFALMSGTSMASPIAAGLAALIKERYPLEGSYEVKVRLRRAPGPDGVQALALPRPERGACLWLQATDTSGQPVSGWVALLGPEEAWARLSDLGEAVFREVTPGGYRLRLWTEGGRYWSADVNLNYSCLVPYRLVVP